MAETPRLSHLFALVFLGGAFCVVVCLMLACYGALRRSRPTAKLGGAGALLTIAGYTAVLLGVGLFSRQKVLSPGEWKYFCEADCHIAYSIAESRVVSTLGSETNPVIAKGDFVVVRVKTWFDENSIGKFRGNAPLIPNPRIVSLVDGTGKTYSRNAQAEAALSEASTSLSEPLRPGESYFTSFVFDVPRQSRDLRLLVADEDPISSLIVDHENSPLHGKILLALRSAASSDPLASR